MPGERSPNPDPEEVYEHEIQIRLADVAGNYLDSSDAGFLEDMDPEDRLGYVYGRLLEIGEDPDQILIESGIIEPEQGEES